MVGYTAIETAVVNKIISHFSTELDASRVKAGDLDSVFEAIFEQGKDYGCFLEFNGGQEDTRKPFDKPVWIWSMVGVLVIRYGDGIEQKLRSVVDKLSSLFAHDHTLGGVTPYVRVSEITQAETGQIQDIPFYWLAFGVEAFDR